MDINTISVKQLRENFDQLKIGLEEGLSYLLIYRSEPLAEIRPVVAKHIAAKGKTKEQMFKIVDKLSGGLKLGKNFTPVLINKILDKRYEEVLS